MDAFPTELATDSAVISSPRKSPSKDKRKPFSTSPVTVTDPFAPKPALVATVRAASSIRRLSVFCDALLDNVTAALCAPNANVSNPSPLSKFKSTIVAVFVSGTTVWLPSSAKFLLNSTKPSLTDSVMSGTPSNLAPFTSPTIAKYLLSELLESVAMIRPKSTPDNETPVRSPLLSTPTNASASLSPNNKVFAWILSPFERSKDCTSIVTAKPPDKAKLANKLSSTSPDNCVNSPRDPSKSSVMLPVTPVLITRFVAAKSTTAPPSVAREKLNAPFEKDAATPSIAGRDISPTEPFAAIQLRELETSESSARAKSTPVILSAEPSTPKIPCAFSVPNRSPSTDRLCPFANVTLCVPWRTAKLP